MRRLLADVRSALRGRPVHVLRTLWLTLLCVCLTGALHAWQTSGPDGLRAVSWLGGVEAGQAWWVALLRTPLSLFVPAPDLPVWGALAQVLVVFGVAEIALGRRWLLLVAYVGTLAGTCFARLGVALGPDVPVLGLPAHVAAERDTGPSAAVLALALALAWRYRAYVTGTVLYAVMLTEALAIGNLAGKEHVTALTVTLALCALWLRPLPRDPA
ncbi:hypothetical protein GCM10009801_36280 [Streptomyces albiaxialis]|uniref:Integral membrane protein n=1 Tax=Streptomyces albiaxialis TaxID=329523 RepID=A0ABP5HJE3_9ACTN